MRDGEKNRERKYVKGERKRRETRERPITDRVSPDHNRLIESGLQFHFTNFHFSLELCSVHIWVSHHSFNHILLKGGKKKERKKDAERITSGNLGIVGGSGLRLDYALLCVFYRGWCQEYQHN